MNTLYNTDLNSCKEFNTLYNTDGISAFHAECSPKGYNTLYNTDGIPKGYNSLPEVLYPYIFRFLRCSERCEVRLTSHYYNTAIMTPECWYYVNINKQVIIPDVFLGIFTKINVMKILIRYGEKDYHDNLFRIFEQNQKTLQYLSMIFYPFYLEDFCTKMQKLIFPNLKFLNGRGNIEACFDAHVLPENLILYMDMNGMRQIIHKKDGFYVISGNAIINSNIIINLNLPFPWKLNYVITDKINLFPEGVTDLILINEKNINLINKLRYYISGSRYKIFNIYDMCIYGDDNITLICEKYLYDKRIMYSDTIKLDDKYEYKEKLILCEFKHL
jgi:hypothetical protein